MTRIAIIGTAGRDKSKPMTKALWLWMVDHAKGAIPVGHHLVSGGAAWADHLAVQLFLDGHASKLTLHLPAPISTIGQGFISVGQDSGGAANYYHRRFSQVIGQDTFLQLLKAIQYGADVTVQLAGNGYQGMFARNKLVARDAEALLAYTFGEGDAPADGGTKDTWDKCRAATKLHVPLPYLT